MKKIILFLLFYAPLFLLGQSSRDFTGPVNAIDFGASSSNTDNTVGINAAISYCISHNRDLYIPGGTYSCNTLVTGSILNFPTNATGIPFSIRIYGDKNTILTSTQKSGNLLQMLNSNYKNVKIENIQFISTHDTTVIGPAAIAIQGANPYLVRNITIQDCYFSGWSNTIVLKGVRGGKIINNIFASPKGHDNATTTTIPAVYIRCIDDTVGDLNKDILVGGNIASGIDTTVTLTFTKTEMDGFFYGHGSNMVIEKNILSKFGAEAIAVQPQTGVSDSGTVLIIGNEIDCHIPVGSLNMDGSRKNTNYGIRCDAPNVTISNNNIYSATQGILQYLTSAYNYTARSWTVQGNHVWMAVDTASAPQYGIYIQGFSAGSRSKGVVVQDNVIYADSSTLKTNLVGVTVNFVDSGTIIKNSFNASRITKAGFSVTGISTNTDTGMAIVLNPVLGADVNISNISSSYRNSQILFTGPLNVDSVITSKLTIGTTRNPVGLVIQDQFNRLTLGGNYVATLPNGTAVPDGTKLVLSGGVGNSNNFLEYQYYTNTEQWTYQLVGQLGTVNSTSFGIILSLQGTTWGINAIFGMDNGANSGKCILEKVLGTAIATSSGAASISTGDSVTITFTRNHEVLTATFLDRTSATSSTVSYTYLYTLGGSDNMVQTAKPRVYLYGGTQNVFSLTFTNNTTRGTSVCFLGNSITQGIDVGVIGNRYPNVIFGSNYLKFFVEAGPSNLIQDIINELPELALMAPKYAYVEIGTNNIGTSETVANFAIEYANLIDKLLRLNIIPILGYVTPRNAVDVSPYNVAIQNIANARGLQTVDVYTPLKASGGPGLNPTYDGGDGLHINAAGHALMASTITTAVPYILTADNLFAAQINNNKTYFNAPVSFGDSVSFSGATIVNTFLPTTDSGYSIATTDWTKRLLATGASFINNQTTLQSSANYNISGKGTALQFSAQGGTTLTAANPVFFAASPIETPTANNQTSSAITINPSFVDGGFTGINHYALNIITGDAVFANGTQFNLNGSIARTLDVNQHTWQSNYGGTTGFNFEFKNQSAIGLTGDVVLVDAVATAGTGGSMLHVKGNSNVEVIKALANGNTLFGTATDNSAFVQTAANTTTVASFFLNGSAVDVSSPTNGMLWYNSTAHTLNFRDNGITTNLLAGGGGVTTVGTFSGSSQTNGASISGVTITFGPADATNPGMVSTGTQTLAGGKTFNGTITAAGNIAQGSTLLQSTNWFISPTNSIRFNVQVAYIGGQTISGGGSVTITNNITPVFVDPASLLSTLTLTMPSSPAQGAEIRIYFGGQIASGSVVVTTLSIVANSGQDLVQPTAPTTAVGGTYISYLFTGTHWYRQN